jgi:hypothetical protein
MDMLVDSTQFDIPLRAGWEQEFGKTEHTKFNGWTCGRYQVRKVLHLFCTRVIPGETFKAKPTIDMLVSGHRGLTNSRGVMSHWQNSGDTVRASRLEATS